MRFLHAAVVLAFIAAVGQGQTPSQSTRVTAVALNKPDELHPRNVKIDWVTYKGRESLRVVDAAPPDVADGVQLVILNKTDFHDGTIEIDLTGEPTPAARATAARGFVGLAFRLKLDAVKDTASYEGSYLRPTSGRTDDQVPRNHVTQYISYPEFPWFRMRKEFPEKYESYADMVPGEWTKVRIEVHGSKASLYMNGAPQPALVIADLKLGAERDGQIALWVGTDTVAHFANLRVSK